ncbi:UDP-glucose 6-dehydrogenase TuaD [Peribacillus sp. SCS-37]|uniref:UDP-glucose 6-dehydrogenase TuaD n=1 Tax=Paraperibacillus esterisolvens TaxID=3115296 RepID=UPI003906D08C
MKKITVIGTGYVGLVSGTCFAEAGNQVICCDINEQKIASLKAGIMPIHEPGLEELIAKNTRMGNLEFSTRIPDSVRTASIIFIAVGTPMSDTGEADLTFVKEAAMTIARNLNGYKIIVTKSTVPAGTGKIIAGIIKEHAVEGQDFDIVSNPEFLREGAAIYETMNMERAVIGTSSEYAYQAIAELHEPFTKTILKTSVESAEMIKYAANAFLATKISFINDIANICERVGADVGRVSEGIGLDTRIGKKFLQAGVGFGGSCFPKDTAALLRIAENCGYEFNLLKAVMETNRLQRDRLVEKLAGTLGSLKCKTISVLGLAFKPDTDDVRYSPALDIIPRLIGMGAFVKAYDPVAREEAERELGQICAFRDDLYDTAKNTDACIILTDWKEIKEMDLVKLKSVLRQPIVVDGRNIFDLKEMQESGLTYLSVGRPSQREKNMISSVI